MISYTVITVLVADLLALSGDISQTWTSPMYPKLYSNDTDTNPIGRPITENEDSWIGSLVNIGAVAGAIPSGLIADRLGRKLTLIAIAIPHITAYLLFAFAHEVYMFYLGRFINGVAMAGYAILPMYVAEVTEDSNRAFLSVSLNVFWCIGNFIPYGIGPYLSSKVFNSAIAAIPITFLIIFVFIGSESPYYLVHIGNDKEAEEVLVKLRSCSKDVAAKEVLKMKELFTMHEDGTLLDILTNKSLRKALIISVLLLLLQQTSGVTAIFYYLQPIFEASGSGLSPEISSTICGASLIVFSLVGTYTVGKAGKKMLLAISCVGDGISLVMLGVYFYIYDETSLSTSNIFWLPIAGVIGFSFFFNIGFSALPWTISSELFPNNVKAISSSAVSCSCWLSSFFVTRFFNLMNDNVGRSGTFFIFAGSCLITVLFDILWVPETRGKSFVQIQEMLQK